MAKKKLSKNQRRRLKKKALRAQKRKEAEGKAAVPEEVKENVELAIAPVEVEIEYISSELRNNIMTDDTLAQFRDVFNKFTTPEELTAVKVINTQPLLL